MLVAFDNFDENSDGRVIMEEALANLVDMNTRINVPAYFHAKDIDGDRHLTQEEYEANVDAVVEVSALGIVALKSDPDVVLVGDRCLSIEPPVPGAAEADGRSLAKPATSRDSVTD